MGSSWGHHEGSVSMVTNIKTLSVTMFCVHHKVIKLSSTGERKAQKKEKERENIHSLW